MDTRKTKVQPQSPQHALTSTASRIKLSSPQVYAFSVQDAMRDKSKCRPRANSTNGELNLPQRGL